MKIFRKWLILAICFLAVSAASAQKQSIDEIYAHRSEYYFSLEVDDLKAVTTLNQIVSVDQYENGKVTAYANKNQYAKLIEAGYSPTLLVPPSLQYELEMIDADAARNAMEWDTYPTYQAYVQMMNDFQTNHPDYCQIFNFGTLPSGRQLLMARINNGETAGKPKFLYTSTMHGDEVTGYVLMLRLIDYFLNNYGTDPRVTYIMDHIDLYINPNANPDGTYNGGDNTVSGATRGNANGIDLNRNYPDPQDGPHPDGNAWQPETVFFMDLAQSTQFTMAANFHGGAEVANYPWDTWPRLHPDDAWWVLVSREFADSAQFYSPAGFFTDLNNGITNGYAWYTTNGCRQDYMNGFANCREETLEVSATKTPPASQLPNFWNYLKSSLLNYIVQSSYGISGVVTDSLTGDPIEAQVFVENHDQDGSHIFSRLPDGNYHRPIKAGTYTVTYSADGYYPKSYTLTLGDGEILTQHVELVPGLLIADFTASAYVISKGESVDFTNASFGQNIVSYEWTFEGGEPASSTVENPQNIAYNETGVFDVSLTITNNDGESSTILREDLIEVNLTYLIQNGTFELCEGLFYDAGGVANEYGNNQDYTMTIKPDQEEALARVRFVSFALEADGSCSYDYLKIYDGPNTMSPLLGTWCGNNSPGEIVASNAEGALTFKFHSDNSVTAAGWEAELGCTSTVDLSEKAIDQLLIWPNPSAGRLITVSTTGRINSLAVVDVAGNEVYTAFTLNKTTQIDLHKLKAGIYFMNVQTDAGRFLRKLVLQ